jgi:hypothetical protein
MMPSLSIVALFAIACAGGALLARRGESLDPPLRAMIGGLCAIVIVGALIGATEASDVIAAHMSFAAIALATAAGVGGFIIAERLLHTPPEDEDQ